MHREVPGYLKPIGIFIIKALVHVAIFILLVGLVFPAYFEPRVQNIQIQSEAEHTRDNVYQEYYDDGEIPPCDVHCVRQMIEDTLDEFGYPSQQRHG